MERYEPPFEITNRMLNRVSSISEKLGRIETWRTLERPDRRGFPGRALSPVRQDGVK